MDIEFERILSNTLTTLMESMDEDPSKFWNWFEARGIAMENIVELGRIGQRIEFDEPIKSKMLVFGLMIGWELHAEVVNENS